jgi:Tol biopolymer transport system component
MRMLRLAVVLVVAAVASTGAAATPSAEQPLVTWAAVWKISDGNHVFAGLCATDPDGHAFRVSDPKPTLPDEPLWAPDGRWIALTRGSDVYVTDAQGRYLRRLTDSSRARGSFYAADWSPDGSKLLVHFSGAFLSRFLLLSRDGTHEQTLVDGQAGSGSWSPDGRRILFATGGAVYVIDTDGTNQRKLVDSARGGVWSPDGQQFAYIAGQGGGTEGLGVARADGTGAHVVAAGFVRSPAWSPDGQQLVYLEHRPNSTQLDLRVVQADGSGDRLLAETVGSGDLIGFGRWGPGWSPDGSAIVFARGQGLSGRVAVINPDGTAERTVATGFFGALNPVWRPSAPLPTDRRPCLIGGSARADVIRGTDRGDLIAGGAGNDTISGADGDDLLIGGSGRDRFYGGRGEDTLIGGSGRDRLYGGLGEDFFRTRDQARDYVFGGPGKDGAYSDGLDRLRSIER